eukprot:1143219-Pelagomonas_calceolata.AAC.1
MKTSSLLVTVSHCAQHAANVPHLLIVCSVQVNSQSSHSCKSGKSRRHCSSPKPCKGVTTVPLLALGLMFKLEGKRCQIGGHKQLSRLAAAVALLALAGL